MNACLRIGHGGASAIAPGNTLASFDAALAAGVDMIEFDVREYRGELLLAHTILDARLRRCLRLRVALDYLAQPRFADVEINLDVKHVGMEAAIADAVEHAGLTDRALVSSQVAAVLDRMRQRDPRIRTGISIGGRPARVSQRWRDWRAQVLDGVHTGRWDALMGYHRLINARLLDEISERGGSLYAWTVNDRQDIDSLRELGVHGITTADPRLFLPSAG